MEQDLDVSEHGWETDDADMEESYDDKFANKYAKQGSQLCSYCDELLLAVARGDKQDDSYVIPEHFERFWNMKKSSQTCGLCWALIEGTQEHMTNSPDLNYPWDRSNYQLDGYSLYRAPCAKPGAKDFCNQEEIRAAGIHEFELEIGCGDDEPRFRFLIMTDEGQGSIPQRAIWSDRLPMQLGSRLPVLNEWLDACISSHALCKRRLDDTRCQPTRLIDLFGSSHIGVFNPKLVLTADLDRSSLKYTTLSHCWGDVQPVRTLTENILEFMVSIFPLYSRTKRRIPRTFADAMKITRALGLRYIWIDSLCIIQNDHADWQAEALRMADIYRGSYLNIASVDGANCNGGCGLDNGWGAMSLSSPRTGGRTFKVRATPADPAHVFCSHLNSRGWVFQEFMLAPRVLFCGRAQFFWQCAEKVYSEDGYIDHHVALHIPREHENDIPDYCWYSWIRDFSQRAFTKITDRLPALHGVVQHYFRETGYSPILGMWKENLVDDLAWRTRQIYHNPFCSYPTERSVLENVPSWSWLSFQVTQDPGGVLYFPPLENRVLSTTVETAEVIWESEPHFSQIVSTKLVVTGPLQKISLKYDWTRRRLYREGDEDSQETDTFVTRLDEQIEDEDALGEILEHWYLLLEHAEVDGEGISTFLVLEALDANSEMRIFRRLGCGRMREKDVKFDKPSIERLELI